MDDLISREELIEAILDARRSETETVLKLIRLIEAQPTAEPKRGHWIKYDNGDVVCSNCGKFEDEFVYGSEYWYGAGESNYCPNCGAKMEADE